MKNKERREVTLQEACIVTKQNTAAVTETEMIPIENACGRIAAEDVSADFDQPSFDRSPLDGLRCVRQISRGLRRNLRQSCQ